MRKKIRNSNVNLVVFLIKTTILLFMYIKKFLTYIHALQLSYTGLCVFVNK